LNYIGEGKMEALNIIGVICAIAALIQVFS
jgi:hypothetical protein